MRSTIFSKLDSLQQRKTNQYGALTQHVCQMCTDRVGSNSRKLMTKWLIYGCFHFNATHSLPMHSCNGPLYCINNALPINTSKYWIVAFPFVFSQINNVSRHLLITSATSRLHTDSISVAFGCLVSVASIHSH